MSDPLVSILIPTYNGERFLLPALRSARAQSHRNIEILVGDDASTDRTPELLSAFAASDPRVRVIRHERNIGGGENPRKLVEEARGEYVKFLMHDDVLANDCVRELLRGMQAHPESSMAFSHRVQIDEDGRPLAGEEILKLRDRPGLIDGRELGDQVLGSCLNHIGEPTTVLFRRADVVPADLWIIDGRTVDVINDLQLWLALLARGPAFYTPRTLSRFRRHGDQASVNPRIVGRAERDWSRLIDWGARHGFLAGEGQLRRAQAGALFTAAARVRQLVDTPRYGAALEAAFLSAAALVELTRPVGDDHPRGLAERAHAPAVRDRFAHELDVWTRVYPVALAAPALDAAEISAMVWAFRELLDAGVAEHAVLTVAPGLVEDVAPLVEQALAEGPDIDVELVPAEDPTTLLPDPWLAVVPRGGRWPAERSTAIWYFDVPGAGGDAGADHRRSSRDERPSVAFPPDGGGRVAAAGELSSVLS